MASATDKALQELKLIQEYLRSQQTVLSSTNMQSVLEQQCTTWETKLRSTVIQPQDASKFVVELGQGPWQEAHKIRLASAIDDAVCGSVQPSSRRRESQTLNDFGPFLSVKDMACLRDRDMPSSVKIDQLVSRMLVLGLHLPTEPTVKAVAVAGMAAGIVCPTPHDGLTLIREIKRRLKQHVKGRAKPANHLVEYPSDPSLLPESIRSVAYKTDDNPTQERMDVNDVQAHSSKIALRSSSRLVRPESQMALVSSSSSSSLNAQANNPQAVMMQLLGNLGQMVQQWQQPQPTQQTASQFTDLRIQENKSRISDSCNTGWFSTCCDCSTCSRELSVDCCHSSTCSIAGYSRELSVDSSTCPIAGYSRELSDCCHFSTCSSAGGSTENKCIAASSPS